MTDITRISDLPENTTMKMPNFMEPIKVSRPRDENNISSPTYQPMLDIHPNPYGVPKPATLPDFTHDQQMPSRDIPRETIGYLQDEQIKVNYIPPPNHTNDYISQYTHDNKEKWDNAQKKKYRLSKLDHLINEFQTSFFLILLFLLFQLPTLNSLLFKYFSFLSIYSSDGNLNTYGLVFKSILFGLFYYLSIKTIDYFCEV